jgi:hypothetical protein
VARLIQCDLIEIAHEIFRASISGRRVRRILWRGAGSAKRIAARSRRRIPERRSGLLRLCCGASSRGRFWGESP